MVIRPDRYVRICGKRFKVVTGTTSAPIYTSYAQACASVHGADTNVGDPYFKRKKKAEDK